mmetsp:Transcript_58251/g.96184  ORF Transcript_58251/g.96184 Transcript_58251/m.96184 type:complete len:108 (-) Transcript_58251:191-514(-)|eukprot:CAMPEP_0119311516 /NCGR_PEP_ID=MMETSP1333-20130426/22707_1 /TAXON_ID=418940 /ORGANISM="Scyphosphaera apsteinii, Strain RCC1455" /LENGTH=107 /DNA_ID=CAMNT_0007315909 /DNA_START=40 /DNA_END=363 /DNA_ORIENTATION=+
MAEDKKTEHKITILKTDMPEEMITDLIAITNTVFDKHKVNKDIATHIKQAFDEKYPPTDNKATSGVYHCVAGTNFACSVTHETHCATYWQCDNVKMLLFKSKDSPFD